MIFPNTKRVDNYSFGYFLACFDTNVEYLLQIHYFVAIYNDPLLPLPSKITIEIGVNYPDVEDSI